jgi:CO dehydrogenase/acetyl-CoA synthase epsilon subunit
MTLIDNEIAAIKTPDSVIATSNSGSVKPSSLVDLRRAKRPLLAIGERMKSDLRGRIVSG